METELRITGIDGKPPVHYVETSPQECLTTTDPAKVTCRTCLRLRRWLARVSPLRQPALLQPLAPVSRDAGRQHR